MCTDWIRRAHNKVQWRDLNDHRNGLSGSSKSGKYLQRFNDYQLLKDSDPWSWLVCGLAETYKIKNFVMMVY
jgi:hypothetical protein